MGHGVRDVAERANWPRLARQQVSVKQLCQLKVRMVIDKAFSFGQRTAHIATADQLVDVNQTLFGFTIADLGSAR